MIGNEQELNNAAAVRLSVSSSRRTVVRCSDVGMFA